MTDFNGNSNDLALQCVEVHVLLEACTRLNPPLPSKALQILHRWRPHTFDLAIRATQINHSPHRMFSSTEPQIIVRPPALLYTDFYQATAIATLTASDVLDVTAPRITTGGDRRLWKLFSETLHIHEHMDALRTQLPVPPLLPADQEAIKVPKGAPIT